MAERNLEGSTRALLDAAQRGDDAEITRLLDAGAPIDAVDDEGRTPLMLAVIGGHRDAIRCLVHRGADLNRQDARGFTALMYTVAEETSTGLLTLLDDGARVDLLNGDGEDAFAIATRLEKSNVFDLLGFFRPIPEPPPVFVDPAFVPRSAHTDFVAAFDGQVEHVGMIMVGQAIVACDPYLVSSARPFSKPLSFPEDGYDVWLALDGHRVACAMLILAGHIPPLLNRRLRWEIALREGDDPANITEDAQAGYSVDYATGCFMSADLAARLAEDQEAYDELTHRMEMAAPWASFRLGTREVIGFRSGGGDGRYPSYWGIDEEGQAICLITDFGLLRG